MTIGCESGIRAARRLVTAVLIFSQPHQLVHANAFEVTEDAAQNGQDYMEVAITGIYQSALQAGEGTGNFEIDLMGAKTILERDNNQTFGSGSLVFWVFSVDNYGDMQSTADFGRKAGLLWPTNDVAISSSFTAFGVFAWQQQLWQDRVTLHAGKLFVGNFVSESPYTASNTGTFMSRVISNDMAGRYFDTMGLGVQLKYNGDGWFATAGAADATAGDEFDFSSFYNGDWTVYGEAGYRPIRSGSGISVVSMLLTSAASTKTLKSQQTVSAAFTHEYGGDGTDYAVFGRYTYGDGGEGKTSESSEAALPLDNGGFIGLAWNKPFDHEGHQIGAALMYGEPTAYRKSQGFDGQFGIESYWKVDVRDWLHVTASIQVVSNIDDKTEIIPGLRAKIHKSF